MTIREYFDSIKKVTDESRELLSSSIFTKDNPGFLRSYYDESVFNKAVNTLNNLIKVSIKNRNKRIDVPICIELGMVGNELDIVWKTELYSMYVVVSSSNIYFWGGDKIYYRNSVFAGYLPKDEDKLIIWLSDRSSSYS